MIVNLFSVFDPSSSIINLSINWIRTILGLSLIPIQLWIIPSRFNILWKLFLSYLRKEFKLLLPKSITSPLLIFVSLFFLIIINNILGLLPYIFTRTRHILITLSLALPIWISFIIYGWIINTNHIFVHLVPQGTPAALISFIVVIETVRNIIRPGTLAIRLAANIIAGHLLITLLGSTGPSLSLILVSILIIGQIALLVLESAVALIQSYVFVTLSVLYSSEVY